MRMSTSSGVRSARQNLLFDNHRKVDAMTKTNNYAAFDQALVSAIAGGATQAGDLTSKLEAQAKPFCVEFRRGASAPPPYRIVDRRLQALRRAGTIAFSHSSGWKVASR